MTMNGRLSRKWLRCKLDLGRLRSSHTAIRSWAFIDWEFAGWYPHYWEYTSAWHGNVIRTGWQDVLHKFLQPYPEELGMEKTRNQWWGEI